MTRNLAIATDRDVTIPLQQTIWSTAALGQLLRGHVRGVSAGLTTHAATAARRFPSMTWPVIRSISCSSEGPPCAWATHCRRWREARHLSCLRGWQCRRLGLSSDVSTLALHAWERCCRSRPSGVLCVVQGAVTWAIAVICELGRLASKLR